MCEDYVLRSVLTLEQICTKPIGNDINQRLLTFSLKDGNLDKNYSIVYSVIGWDNFFEFTGNMGNKILYLPVVEDDISIEDKVMDIFDMFSVFFRNIINEAEGKNLFDFGRIPDYSLVSFTAIQ